MIRPPLLAYPVPPAHGPDAAYYARFLAALAEDLDAMTALEELLRPFGEHTWRDEQGWQRTILAMPTMVRGECDWPTRLRRDGNSLEACPGATALGHGAYDGMNDTPPIANPDQIYTTRELTPDSWPASESGALTVWMSFVHSFVEVHGQPLLALDQAGIGAGASMPADDPTTFFLPLAFRLSGAAAVLFSVAVGAIEFRHTPEPIPFDPGEIGDPLEAPLPGSSSGGGSGGGSDGSGSGGGSGSTSGGSSTDNSNSPSSWNSSGASSDSSNSSQPSSDVSSSVSGSGSSSSSSSIYSSSSDSDSDSSSSSSSKIIVPVNVDGELAFVGWCAVEAPNQQLEVTLEIRTGEDGTGWHTVPDWMMQNRHRERPNWQIVSAWSASGALVAATFEGLEEGRTPDVVVRAADYSTLAPVEAYVVVRVRCASKCSLEPWQDEPDPKRREASRKFHEATRRHA